MAAETRAEVVGGEQTVFDRVAELEQQLQEAQAKLERQRGLKNAAQRRWRQRHPEDARRRNREWRARRRQNLSAESASEPPRLEQEREALNTNPELVDQQRRRERKAAYMREWRARKREQGS